jgi:hypothetical protein
MKTREEAEEFIRWVDQNVFKSNDMDKLSFAEIAEVAKKEFPEYVIDEAVVQTTVWGVSKHKNMAAK